MLGVRLPAAPEDRFTAQLQGIDPAARYRFEEGETGETRELTGAALAQQGFALTLPARSGTIWFYERLDDNAG